MGPTVLGLPEEGKNFLFSWFAKNHPLQPELFALASARCVISTACELIDNCGYSQRVHCKLLSQDFLWNVCFQWLAHLNCLQTFRSFMLNKKQSFKVYLCYSGRPNQGEEQEVPHHDLCKELLSVLQPGEFAEIAWYRNSTRFLTLSPYNLRKERPGNRSFK